MPRNFMRKRDANEFSDTLIESDDSSKTISQVDTGEFRVKSKIWTKNMQNGDRPNIFQEQIDNLVSTSYLQPRVSVENVPLKSIPQDAFKLPAPKATQSRRKPRQLSPSESVSRGAPLVSFNNRGKSLCNGNSSRYPQSEHNRFSSTSRKYGEERIMDYGEEDRRRTDFGRSRMIRDNDSCFSTTTNVTNCMITAPLSMLLKGSKEGRICPTFVVDLLQQSQNPDLAYQDIQVPDRISQLDARSFKSRMSVVSRAPSIISRARSRKSFKSIRGQRHRKSLHRRGSLSLSDESDDSCEPTLEEEELDSQNEFRKPSIEGLKVLKQNRNSSGGQRPKKNATPQQPKKKSTPQLKKKSTPQPARKSSGNKKTPLQEPLNKSQQIFENAEAQNATQPSIIKRKLFSQSSEMIDNDPLRTRVSMSPSPAKSKLAPKLDLNKVRLSSNSRLSLQSLIKPKSLEIDASKGVATFIGLPRHESTMNPDTAHRFLHTKPSSAKEHILANSELPIRTNVTIHTPIIPKPNAQKDHNSGENSSQSARENDATIIHKAAPEKNQLASAPKSTKWLTDGSDDNDTDVEQNKGCKGVATSEATLQNQDIPQSARKNKKPPKMWIECDSNEKATEMEINTDNRSPRKSARKNKKPPKMWIDECDSYVKATEKEIKTAPEIKQPPPKKLRTESKIEAVNPPKSKNVKEVTAPTQTAKSTRKDTPPQVLPELNNKRDSLLTTAKAQMQPFNNRRLKEIYDTSREYSRTPRRSPRVVCKNKYFQSRYSQAKDSDLKTVTARSRAQFPKTPIEIKNNLKEIDISKLSPILKTKAAISPIRCTSKDINETIDKIKKKSQQSYPDKNMDINDVLKKVDDHVRSSKRGSFYAGGVLSDDEETVAPLKRAPLERIENRISKSSKSIASFASFNKSMASRFKPREAPSLFPKCKPDAPSESNYRYNCGKSTISRGSSFKSTKSARFGHYFF